MKLLLDSHIFLWWAGQSVHLSVAHRAACEDGANTILLSIASIWEMQIKVQLGKLQLTRPLPEPIARQEANNALQLLSISPAHIFALGQLPPHHRDPFDRLLIAQAITEEALILSIDDIFRRYDVPLL